MTLAAEIDRKVRDSFARQQAMVTIGASLVGLARGEAEIALPFDPKVTQQHGFVHGGVVAMIADSACGYAALSTMPREASVLTVEFKLNLLAPAKGERFVAAGRVVRPGRRLVVTLGEVFAEEAGRRKQVAMIVATMMAIEGDAGIRD